MTNYLIIGRGRLARHLQHYFQLLGLHHTTWHRERTKESLIIQANAATRILLCVSDQAIAQFANDSQLPTQKLVHFSGAQFVQKITGVHPLMSFGPTLYDLETYKKIPFITERGGALFTELFPDLPNPHFPLAPQDKALYHALCVMAGNFTTLLWQNIFDLFEKELHVPHEALGGYLKQTLANTLNDRSQALTGPLSRGDTKTLVQNLDALRDRPEQKLYYAFLNYALEKRKTLGDLQYERLNF